MDGSPRTLTSLSTLTFALRPHFSSRTIHNPDSCSLSIPSLVIILSFTTIRSSTLPPYLIFRSSSETVRRNLFGNVQTHSPSFVSDHCVRCSLDWSLENQRERDRERENYAIAMRKQKRQKIYLFLLRFPRPPVSPAFRLTDSMSLLRDSPSPPEEVVAFLRAISAALTGARASLRFARRLRPSARSASMLRVF